MFYQAVAFNIHGKTQKDIDKFKIPALKWNDKLELFDGLYSASDIQIISSMSSKKWNTDW